MSLLDDRIKEYDIPPLPYEPFGDRIVVYMIPEAKTKRDTYIEGGRIHMPEVVKSNEERASARGILIGAGLRAMDSLRGYGIELGMLLWVSRLSPWRHVVDRTEKGEVEMMFLSVGDIVGCEDVLKARQGGKVSVQVGDDGLHRFVLSEGTLPRFDPPSYNA